METYTLYFFIWNLAITPQSLFAGKDATTQSEESTTQKVETKLKECVKDSQHNQCSPVLESSTISRTSEYSAKCSQPDLKIFTELAFLVSEDKGIDNNLIQLILKFIIIFSLLLIIFSLHLIIFILYRIYFQFLCLVNKFKADK